MFEFAKMWRVLPDTWQSQTVYRVGRRLGRLIAQDASLQAKLKAAEARGSMKEVKKIIEHVSKEEIQEMGRAQKIGRQIEVLELHQTQKLGEISNLKLRVLKGKIDQNKLESFITKINGCVDRFKELEKL